MYVNIGAEIQRVAKEQRFSQEKVANLIGESQQNISNDYKRESLSIVRLLKYSQALNHNFLQYYYEVEPLKSYREEELNVYKEQINALTKQLEEIKAVLGAKEEATTYQKQLIDTQDRLIKELEKKSR